MTQVRLAGLAGCAKGYLSLIESGHKGPPSDELLERLEDALGLPRGELITAARWQELPDSMQAEIELLRNERLLAHRLAELLDDGSIDESGRVVGALERARCNGELRRIVGALGGGQRTADTDEDISMEVPVINAPGIDYRTGLAGTPDGYVRAPNLTDADAFALRVVGDSMRPDYREGDIVVFSPLQKVRSGADCFAMFGPDRQAAFQRAYFENENSSVRLQPINSAYPPIIVPRHELHGLYAAFSATRSVTSGG